MSILICDRCGDVTVDAMSCWCGATVDTALDLSVRRRDHDAPSPAGAVADDPTHLGWIGGTAERTRQGTAVPHQAGPVDAPRASAG